MSLAPFVRILGRGPGRSRSFTRDEATEAMTITLNGQAEPQAVGAMLMLLRMKGETPDEIAGFVSAARATMPALPRPALDWPSYAAGRTRGLPWFLLATRLVAQAGHPVLLHGWNSHQQGHASVRRALPHVGIQSTSPDTVADVLNRDGIAYLPLESFAPQLLDLLQLRDVLGLRSCINTVLRVLNPACAPAGVQGVFHPPYRDLQADAGVLLGQQSLTIIKGGGGEFERHPCKGVQAYGLRAATRWEAPFDALLPETRRLNDGADDPARLTQLWQGTLNDEFAERIVTGTAALALDTLGVSDPEQTALALWADRRRAKAA
ncbi:glycosyl transferase family protein [Puniceibacterium sediminis]|uniref:Anthranilate phosphoribosyltransferase n=1 Tax=Puniceibacterium sediminis TaxID=1608407 RepID=A0A238WSX8_9RHOB|nr:glycosyl transferase family protein [Puniceibacterium sediminis]SNR49676.1 Anthranilate phosphoribosyltransferase [Puniceibacterium sediminis]